MAAQRLRVFLTGLVGGPGITFFYRDTALGTGSAQDFADAVAAMLNGMKAITSNTLTWTTDTVVEDFDRSNGQTLLQTAIGPNTVTGTDTAHPLSPATQGLGRWKTGQFVNGRQVQGHTFWPCPTEAVNDSPGKPSAGYVSGATAQMDLLIAAGVGACVWSRKNGQLYEIIDASVWNQWAVLRKRRDG